jgi:putative ABC transport system permease protein
VYVRPAPRTNGSVSARTVSARTGAPVLATVTRALPPPAISVLERRREIGLRRSLGATRGHIRAQFLAEALLLSALGGVAGCVLGTTVTAVFSFVNAWPVALPPQILAAALAATLVMGAAAGLYPATRAARTPPTTALSSA